MYIVYTNIFPSSLPSEGWNTIILLLLKVLFINNILHWENSGLSKEKADSKCRAKKMYQMSQGHFIPLECKDVLKKMTGTVKITV